MKGLVTRNTHTQYESPITSGLKVMAKVKVFQKWVTLQGQDQKLWYHVKGLVTSTTHVQYESPITSSLKIIARVKFFKSKQTSKSRS